MKNEGNQRKNWDFSCRKCTLCHGNQKSGPFLARFVLDSCSPSKEPEGGTAPGGTSVPTAPAPGLRAEEKPLPSAGPRSPRSQRKANSSSVMQFGLHTPPGRKEKENYFFFLQNLGKTNLDLTFVSNPLSVNLPQAEHMPGAAE